jgi:hypothetical protein
MSGKAELVWAVRRRMYEAVESWQRDRRNALVERGAEQNFGERWGHPSGPHVGHPSLTPCNQTCSFVWNGIMCEDISTQRLRQALREELRSIRKTWKTRFKGSGGLLEWDYALECEDISPVAQPPKPSRSCAKKRRNAFWCRQAETREDLGSTG